MFILEKLGVLPSKFLDLKDGVPLCVSCMFVKASRRERRSKVKKLGSIRKETENKTRAGVSVDQLQ